MARKVWLLRADSPTPEHSPAFRLKSRSLTAVTSSLSVRNRTFSSSHSMTGSSLAAP
jgi:hypothetical protein